MVDILRRAGVEVVTAGLVAGPIRASRGVVVLPDTTLDAVAGEDFDMVVLPGGQPGTDTLAADPRVRAILARHAQRGAYTAAICAAPKVLAEAGLLEGRRATAYPGVLEARAGGITLEEAPVVRDGRVVTSRGPGTAMDFALELAELLAGPQRRREVEAALQRP
ncbi:4-methyl-5(b-hydroxyethyl)-thiazole monophosphate biosynthesis [Inmirania thermothiophila]|uniref:4-methyl-5(B-hydroxyethyl)-thiazole monophosphate biosynthesis n=1 Tax=Inmirania thermothiophila TaxID=1750597 RepID=A0A3N1Y6S1_9GAMM|nr:4-methyl-5(b-hydroxyethyl)-thiazole monophosphate biosynthesis [Inmirania thermothiophila]